MHPVRALSSVGPDDFAKRNVRMLISARGESSAFRASRLRSGELFRFRIIKSILKFGALSSVGSEHLPYKQGVTGSNPVGPTSSIIPMEFTPSGFLFSKRLKFTSQEYGKQKSKYALKRRMIFYRAFGRQVCRSGFPMDMQSSFEV